MVQTQSKIKVGCRDDEVLLRYLDLAMSHDTPVHSTLSAHQITLGAGRIDVRTAEDHPNALCSISLISLDEREWSSEAPHDIRTEWNVRTTGTTTYSLTYVDPGTAPTR